MEIKFNGFRFVVNEASIKNNNLPAGNFNLMPQIQRKIGKANDIDNSYVIEITVEIHNTVENPFPIELIANVAGIFNIEGDDQEAINKFLFTQGFQMLFPHVRALVANMTSNAMMQPIFLPIVYTDAFKDVPLQN